MSATGYHRLKLSAGALSVEVLPELGAALSGLRLRLGENSHLLMREVPDSFHPAGYPSGNRFGDYSWFASNFLMAPYSNRIRDGRFAYRGQAHQLKNAELHAIHGDVYHRPFSITDLTQTSAELLFNSADCTDFNYPYELSARVRYEISPDSLNAVLELCNRDTVPIPLGGGFHPYFSRRLTPGEDAATTV
jgi:aldose 1-epimerase